MARSESTENIEKLANLFTEWSSLIDKNKLILINDYFYKDPLLEKMRPTAAYTYALGLDLALNYSIDSIETNIQEFFNNNTTATETDYPLEIKNKHEFIENISRNKEILRERNPALKLHKCKLCDFKAETLVILDQHLAHPHFYTSVFICNFCTHFKTSSKEEYKNHVLKEHNRTSFIEKPLQYACQKCNFESDRLDRLTKHEQLTCPFKGIDSLIDNLLAPNKFDFLEFEYLFNEKPIETNECSSALLDMSTYQTHFHYEKPIAYEFNLNKQAKVVQNLIDNSKPPINIVHSIITINKRQQMTPLNFSNRMSNLFYKCHLCSMIFLGELRLKSYNEHLKIAHNIIDEKSVSKLIKPFSNISTVQKPLVIKISNNTSYHSSSQNFQDFNYEKKYIYEILIKNKDDLLLFNNDNNIECLLNQIVEFKNVREKCFKCLGSHAIEYDLLAHFNSVHNSSIKSITTDLLCLFCGYKFINREKLIIHQFNLHKSITFLSVNKLFSISNETTNPISLLNPKKQAFILPKVNEMPIFLIPHKQENNSGFSSNNSNKAADKSIEINENKKRISITTEPMTSKKIKNIKEEKCYFCSTSFESGVKYKAHLEYVHMRKVKINLVDCYKNEHKI